MTLPSGWFTQLDVTFYRELVSRVPVGGKIAEIGVWQGRSLCSVADIIIANDLSVVAVDIFTGTVSEPVLLEEAGRTDIRDEFIKNIKEFGILDRTFVLPVSSAEAVKQIADGELDMGFIDAEHTEKACSEDIEIWYPKIKDGGILAGHDYKYHGGVHAAVNKAFGSAVQSDNNIWYIIKTKKQ